eukprot:751198-Hanusia_phi.AAC.1
MDSCSEGTRMNINSGGWGSLVQETMLLVAAVLSAMSAGCSAFMAGHAGSSFMATPSQSSSFVSSRSVLPRALGTNGRARVNAAGLNMKLNKYSSTLTQKKSQGASQVLIHTLFLSY